MRVGPEIGVLAWVVDDTGIVKDGRHSCQPPPARCPRAATSSSAAAVREGAFVRGRYVERMAQQMVRWDDFVQRVRRHRPSELLAAIATTNISVAPDGMWEPSAGGPLFPWALAVAARESIRAGNEHRASGVTQRDLAHICGMYHNLYDPVVEDEDAVAALVRIAFEQFPFQEALFFGAARSRLLFEQPSPEAAARLRIVDSSVWRRVIGQPLDVLFNTGMLLGVGALKNGGRFDLAWFKQPNFAAIREQVTEGVVRDLMATTFATDIPTFKTMCPSSYQRGYERVSFNPLQARPFIRQDADGYLAPVPQFVFWRASAPSLYYLALEKLTGPDRNAFTDDVGTLFEDYVFRQARQLPLELLLPAVEYEPAKHTTDAILVWPDFVLLIEAKATRLTETSRKGGPTLRPELNRTISRAFEQLDTTAALVRDRHPALAQVPGDRPVYGLVITLEPYPFINAVFTRDELQVSKPSMPVAVASVQDFERFVADAITESLDANAMASLLDPDGGGDAWSVDALVQRKNGQGFRNPLLDAEYNRLAGFGIQVNPGQAP
jgi:hypothetical protein